MKPSSRINIPITTKLILGFLLIILILSVGFTLIGVQLIGKRIITEAQEMVREDFNSAREIYNNKLEHIGFTVRFTSERFFLRDALIAGNVNTELVVNELIRRKESESLDIFTITDASGKVLLRTSHLAEFGDDQSHDELIQAVLSTKEPVAGATLISAQDLEKESPLLANKAHIVFIDTPMAKPKPETEETSGMMLKAAAPIFDYDHNMIGIIYGGVLLNRNYEIVDRIKHTVFQDMVYKGNDIGTATIFQDDLRISTNVSNSDGSRAIGTRIAEQVYQQVVEQGKPWVGRAYVVNDWYITTYEPIRSINNQIIGILYVGILERKYLDIRNQIVLAFLSIMLAGMLIAMVLSYFISQWISVPIKKLGLASEEISRGNLDARVEITSTDELGELALAFNIMAASLGQRDKQLKEFTTQKIMQSERLAMVGQLAANVAHELNNPLQGIMTYSHLLLEKLPEDNSTRGSIQKIANQTERCRDIIRGLLDFSRQKKPQKKHADMNLLAQECVSLIEKQALFHNVQIVENYLPDIPPVVVDPSQIQQVFMNMIINAAEAMDGNGQLTLTTCLDPTGKYINIDFSDTGHGISEENMDKIFDPFFTTKDVGHGTGLGLAISYGIIKEHKGSIAVQSKVGVGTTFTVRIPLTNGLENNGN